MTAAPTLKYIPDIVDEHYDELQFLWAQRRVALRSSAYTERELLMLEARIEAHVAGLLVLGEEVVPFLESGMIGEEDLPAFAAAFALLSLGTPAGAARVMHGFASASGKKLDGLRDALAQAPSNPLAAELTAVLASGAPTHAAAAGQVLAFHGAAVTDARQLERLLFDEMPAARAGGWRLVGYGGMAVSPRWFDVAFQDDEVAVRNAAIHAAAWTGSPSFASHCRTVAVKPAAATTGDVALFAAVAAAEEYQLLENFAGDGAAGPDRFRVIGSFGHPYFIDFLIREMSNPDPASALGAGAAFFKMTGRDVESNTRVKVSPDGKPPADDFEAEFQDEVFLPDPDLARKHWQELAPTLARAPRICRGMDVSQTLSREQFAALDMESRSEYCLRMRLFGGWQGTPLVLERYPQRF